MVEPLVLHGDDDRLGIIPRLVRLHQIRVLLSSEGAEFGMDIKSRDFAPFSVRKIPKKTVIHKISGNLREM